MQIPFTHDAFLDLFARYNASLWPVAAGLWVLTAALVYFWLRTGAVAGRGAFALLAVHWLWSGAVYHWVFFRTINPAAAAFAALFVLQGAWFAWLAVNGRAVVVARPGLRRFIGAGLLLYALAYPLIGLALGLRYPRIPLFAVPCPTVLMTAGLLISSSGVPRAASTAPILWSIIGSSAAFLLGVDADLALVVAAALLVLDMVAPSALGVRSLSS